jgi:peptidoglycan-N-acetylglucosamine deacetylase
MIEMRLIKRIKWPGWVVLVLFFSLISGAIQHFTSTKTEAYVEVSESLNDPVSNQEGEPDNTDPIQEGAENEEPNTVQPEADEPADKNEENDEQGQENPVPQTEFDPSGKYIALTFDDGPHPNVTPKILQTLREHNVKGTFFMMGSQVEKYPDMAKQVADDGHEIGNHTYSHPNMRKRTTAEMIEEIRTTNEMIELATGIEPSLFRPPYGIYTSEVLEYAGANDYLTVLWSVDSLDWKSKNAGAIHNTVTQHVTNGSVVLMHDIHTATAEALPELIETLQTEGYQFVTVSELMAMEQECKNEPYYGKVI